MLIIGGNIKVNFLLLQFTIQYGYLRLVNTKLLFKGMYQPETS